MTFGDLLILLVSVGLLLFASLAVWQTNDTRPDRLVIASGGKIVSELDIHQDQVVEIDGLLGVSELEIRDGRARFRDSPCSNRQCILRGWVSESGDTVICLPNRISATITGVDTYYDAVNF